MANDGGLQRSGAWRKGTAHNVPTPASNNQHRTASQSHIGCQNMLSTET